MDKNITCLIVDDEREAHYVLINYLKRNPDLLLKGQFYDAQTAIAFLKQEPVDIVFLDINMPGLNGFGLISALTIKPKIIFTTAYMDFALDAFDVGALDYLVKPIPYPRFEQAIARFKERFIKYVEPGDVVSSIILKTDKGMAEFMLDEIYYFQSWGNYVKVFFEDYYELCPATTVEIEKMLPENTFSRIHKSYIVSHSHIQNIQRSQLFINGYLEPLPIGITYKRALLTKLNQ